MATAHSTLGASGAGRWMNCPGSVPLAGRVPPEQRARSSSYADEGTAAHAVAEACLRTYLDVGDAGAAQASVFVGLLWHLEQEVFVEDGPAIGRLDPVVPVTDEMAEAVQLFVDWAIDKIESLGGLDVVEVRIEEHVNLSWLGRDDLWGTADLVIIQPYGRLVVADYKHGRGVVVEAENNAQGSYYALGPLYEAGPGDIEMVEVVIAQPRAPHDDGPIRTWEVEPDYLMAWAQELKAAADMTDRDDAPLLAGEWCRFCSARGICPALESKVAAATRAEFDDLPTDPNELPEGAKLPLPSARDPEGIARALTALPLIDAWVSGVHAIAHQSAVEAGVAIPGYKVVRKSTNRQWKDAAEVERKLKNRAGVRVDEFMAKRKLKSPAQVEKIHGLKDWVKEHAEKPEGDLTVAKQSDRRAEVDVAQLLYPAGDDTPAENPSPGADLFGD